MALNTWKTNKTSATLVNAVATKFTLPHGSREHVIRLESGTVAFRWHIDEDALNTAVSNGFPMPAGDVLTFQAVVAKHDIFVRQDSGGPIVAHWGYLYPNLR